MAIEVSLLRVEPETENPAQHFGKTRQSYEQFVLPYCIM
jgi:hypothetical protein